MYVDDLNNMKSVVFYDAAAINPQSDLLKSLSRYGLGLEYFIEKSKVKTALLRMPEDSQAYKVNLHMEITHDPVSVALKKLIGKKLKLFVGFGHVEELLHEVRKYKVKNTIIITDDDISQYNIKLIKDNVRIIPGRILFYLYDAFWWRVTPFEMMDESMMQVDVLPDRYLNELGILAQRALQCYTRGKEEEYQEILTSNLTLYTDHVMTQMIITGLTFSELQNGGVNPEQRAEHIELIVNDLIRMNYILSNSPRTRANKGSIRTTMTKVVLLARQVLQFVNQNQYQRLFASFGSVLNLGL